MKKFLKACSALFSTAVLTVCLSITSLANSEHPMLNFRDYNEYKAHKINSWEDAQKYIERDNLVLVNDTAYERFDELYACMREEGDDYYDFEAYDYWNEGHRLYVYASEEMVEAFLSTNTEEGRANQSYGYAKVDFVNDVMLVYEYTLNGTGEEFGNSNQTASDGEWGTLSAIAYLDKEIVTEITSETEVNASVTLKNLDTGNTYQISLAYPDYTNSQNIVTGNYEITSAFYSTSYKPAVYLGSESEENLLYEGTDSVNTFYIGSLESKNLLVKFGEPMTTEEYKESVSEVAEEIVVVPEETESEEEVTFEVPEEKGDLTVIGFCIIALLVLVPVVAILFFANKKKKANMPH